VRDIEWIAKKTKTVQCCTTDIAGSEQHMTRDNPPDSPANLILRASMREHARARSHARRN